MLVTLLKKEFLEHVLSLRFIVASVLSLVLVTLSLIVLRADYVQKKEAYDLNRETYRKEAERLGDYTQLQMQGIHVDRPPAKLQVSYYGLEKVEDKTAQVMVFMAPGPQGELYRSPASALFPTPDILYVVATVLSLMAFVFSYDAVCGERESGTMRLMLSYSVPRDKFILAKWLGGYLSLATPFVISLVVAALIILVSRSVGFTGNQWAAYVLAAIGSLLFIAVMFSLGMFVSSRCARSATAIMILLFIWVGMVLFVPNVSPYISNQVKRVTPSDVLESRMRQEVTDLAREFTQKMEQLGRKYQPQFQQGGEVAQQAMVEFGEEMNKTWKEFQNNTNMVGERNIRDFENELDGQIAVAKIISRLSPVSSYVYIATDLAATGVRKQLHFMDALREYQTAFRGYLNRKTEGQFPFGNQGGQGSYDISDMPVFEYVEEPIPARVAGSLLDFGLLSVEALFFFMAAFMSFLRADVI
jgi:ABC-type transport system involved in multi-copper enzyme maturation permease subunit